MDIRVIQDCTALSLSEQITFPEVVMKLSAAGVERYIADLVGKQKFSYGINGEAYTGTLAFDGPSIPQRFDAASVQATIKDIQQERIKYQAFLRRIMEAGCSHYEVFITGRKAIYFGRDGSQHTEIFPST